MGRYLVVIEGDDETNYSAYVPDLPGCITTGKTVEKTVRMIREAMASHLAWMRRDGDPIPPQTTRLGDPLELTDETVGVIELTAATYLPTQRARTRTTAGKPAHPAPV